MCGRYYIEEKSEAFREILREVDRKQGNSIEHASMKVGEIFPTNIVPVIEANGAELMKWGYSGYKSRVINARSETAFEKAMFRKSLLKQRCLVPASGYFEWKRTQSGGKTKQKYALFRPGKPIYMAGLWRLEQGEKLPVFVILTREAGTILAVIHDRMPVILPEEICDDWLAETADAGLLMQQAIQEIAYQAV